MKNFLAAFFCGSCFILGAADLAGLKGLWTEPDDGKRCAALDAMQKLVDRIPKAEFDAFDGDPQAVTRNPVLGYYDASFDRLLADIPATRVEPGTAVLWYLYNMGFVIKTPEACFGVDIHHRRAEALAPLLDFVAVTHNHDDHYSLPLMRRMTAAGKPVVSNFFPNPGYTKAAEYTRTLPGVTVHCSEADHNSRLRKFTMPMEFVCTTGDRKFVFFTSGDCCSHEFLGRKSERIHLYVLHPRCAMSPAAAVVKLDPDMTFICHLQELGHEINRYRWPVSVGRTELKRLEALGKKAYVPVWGEKFLWDGRGISVRRK